MESNAGLTLLGFSVEQQNSGLDECLQGSLYLSGEGAGVKP